ncbi:hypothetical protein HORIV_07030 [Vreelandella olivaria]|uniref:Uncharacterized protein n=1 Tax=Vreelandella olivaria TaxID=390919 RepID=A0ABM7GD40_9GAMM|nr:hypothetical protein HORIV_07030 [Halomonas olivaria]
MLAYNRRFTPPAINGNIMNADLDALHPYPFEKLAALKAELTPRLT